MNFSPFLAKSFLRTAAASSRPSLLTKLSQPSSVFSRFMSSPSPSPSSNQQQHQQNEQQQQSSHKSSSGESNNQDSYEQEQRRRRRVIGLQTTAIVVIFTGLSYAAVPLYRAFCQQTGFGGTVNTKKKKALDDITDRWVTITFNSDVSENLSWRFVPAQKEMRVRLGETALAFYYCHNPNDKAQSGVATYNVTPQKSGIYFNKLQCFCFEEQSLQANEMVEMPVFFYVDPSLANDENMDDVSRITLSYTFFNSAPLTKSQIEQVTSQARSQAGLKQ